MAESKSMVSIVAIVAVVILVGLAVWFIREESDEGLDIDIGAAAGAPVWVASGGTLTPAFAPM